MLKRILVAVSTALGLFLGPYPDVSEVQAYKDPLAEYQFKDCWQEARHQIGDWMRQGKLRVPRGTSAESLAKDACKKSRNNRNAATSSVLKTYIRPNVLHCISEARHTLKARKGKLFIPGGIAGKVVNDACRTSANDPKKAAAAVLKKYGKPNAAHCAAETAAAMAAPVNRKKLVIPKGKEPTVVAAACKKTRHDSKKALANILATYSKTARCLAETGTAMATPAQRNDLAIAKGKESAVAAAACKAAGNDWKKAFAEVQTTYSKSGRCTAETAATMTAAVKKKRLVVAKGKQRTVAAAACKAAGNDSKKAFIEVQMAHGKVTEATCKAEGKVSIDAKRCVTLVPWKDASVPPNGATIAIRMRRVMWGRGGRQFDSKPWPRWMGLSPTKKDAIEATDKRLTSRNLFTVKVFNGASHFNMPWIILQAANGKYVAGGSGGSGGNLTAKSKEGDAWVFGREYTKKGIQFLRIPPIWKDVKSWYHGVSTNPNWRYYTICLNAFLPGTSWNTTGPPHFGCWAHGAAEIDTFIVR